MKISTIPMDKSRKSGLNSADQFIPLGDGGMMFNTFVWRTFLNLQDIIRAVLSEKFAEVGIVCSGFFDSQDDPLSTEEVDRRFKDLLEKKFGLPQKVFFFHQHRLDEKKYAFITSDVKLQMTLYSFFGSLKEMSKQCHEVQTAFLEIFHRIDLAIESKFVHITSGEEHSAVFQCWGSTVGEINPISVDNCYGIRACIDISQIVDSLIWVYNSARGLYLSEGVCPFYCAIITWDSPSLEDTANKVHNKLLEHGFTVLWDDRKEVPCEEKVRFASMLGVHFLIILEGSDSEATSEQDFLFKVKNTTTSTSWKLTMEELLQFLKDTV